MRALAPSSPLASAHAALLAGAFERAEAGYRQVLSPSSNAGEARLNSSATEARLNSSAGEARLNSSAGEARMGLGIALARQGRLAEARTELAEAATLLPRERKGEALAGALLDLAFEQQQIHAHADSLKPLARALKLAPASARAHHLHALALDGAGDLKAAHAAATRAVALLASLPAGNTANASNAVLLLASLDARLGRPDAARERLEALAARTDDPNHARARFELGRVLDRQKQPDAAFDTVREAGRATLATLPFDLDAPYRELAADADLAGRWPFTAPAFATAPTGAAPVFLVGFYRSGTTLLEQILAAHPRLLTSDEADLLPWLLRRIGPDWAKQLETGGEARRREWRDAYFRRARQLFGTALEGRMLIDKTALNTVNLAFIHAVFPEAKLLLALRDPRDVCVSAHFTAFTPNPLTAQWLDWDRGVRFYAAVMRHALTLRETLGFDWLSVRYEDVVADHTGEARRVFAHLGLEWDERVAGYRGAAADRAIATPSRADVARPIHANAIARWHAYAKHFEAHRDTLAPLLDAWGYAAD